MENDSIMFTAWDLRQLFSGNLEPIYWMKLFLPKNRTDYTLLVRTSEKSQDRNESRNCIFMMISK